MPCATQLFCIDFLCMLFSEQCGATNACLLPLRASSSVHFAKFAIDSVAPTILHNRLFVLHCVPVCAWTGSDCLSRDSLYTLFSVLLSAEHSYHSQHHHHHHLTISYCITCRYILSGPPVIAAQQRQLAPLISISLLPIMPYRTRSFVCACVVLWV